MDPQHLPFVPDAERRAPQREQPEHERPVGVPDDALPTRGRAAPSAFDDRAEDDVRAPVAARAAASAAPVAFETLLDAIDHTWGFRELRPLQERAMRAILGGGDLLLVLPTGGGKSLVYQAPALVRPGLTVVVSPLLSLMKDQVDGLVANGVAAAMLASDQSTHERRAVHRALEAGELDLLFVSPERLALDGFLERLAERGVAAVAVDEAHCISHWGHDFRPEYRQLGEIRRRLPQVPLHAFTATATQRVREDIVRQLGLAEPDVLVGRCDRPNLTYRVRQRGDLLRQVLGLVERHQNEAGIVYCISRKDTEELAAQLRGHAVRAAHYHAGMPADERRRTQDAFQAEEIDVIVATVAFGMGIDRPDVRFVAHAALPKGMEQYSQETGRAGRDGLPAECVLFFSAGDFHSWRGLLERAQGESDPETLEAAIERVGEMLRFATGGICRHRALVEHFGQAWGPDDESAGNGCGACDVCLGELAQVEDALVIAQKILSCVVHCEQRYGAAHVCDVLRGANTAGVRRAGHEHVSTYGLLAKHDVREIRGWIDQLVGAGHLRVSSGRYPTLFLSKSGVEVLRGERAVTLVVQPLGRPARKGAGAPRVEAGDPPIDEALFEHLRGVRRELARERGVPPYIVFGDRTLAQMAARKPRDLAAFRALRGVGDKKAADLGPPFLEAIETWLRTRGGGSSA